MRAGSETPTWLNQLNPHLRYRNRCIAELDARTYHCRSSLFMGSNEGPKAAPSDAAALGVGSTGTHGRGMVERTVRRVLPRVISFSQRDVRPTYVGRCFLPGVRNAPRIFLCV